MSLIEIRSLDLVNRHLHAYAEYSVLFPYLIKWHGTRYITWLIVISKFEITVGDKLWSQNRYCMTSTKDVPLGHHFKHYMGDD